MCLCPACPRLSLVSPPSFLVPRLSSLVPCRLFLCRLSSLVPCPLFLSRLLSLSLVSCLSSLVSVSCLSSLSLVCALVPPCRSLSTRPCRLSSACRISPPIDRPIGRPACPFCPSLTCLAFLRVPFPCLPRRTSRRRTQTSSQRTSSQRTTLALSCELSVVNWSRG